MKIDTKICSRCKKERPLSDFHKDRTAKDWLQHCCKDCTKIRNKERLQRNNELRRNRNNQPIMEGTKTCAICGRELPVDMFGIAKRESDGRRYECNDCRKKEREENSEYMKSYRKEYYKENKDKIKERSKRFYQEHKTEIRIRSNEYNKSRRNTNDVYKLKMYIGHAIRLALKYKKTLRRNTIIENVMGINGAALKKYLLKTFEKRYGYEWDGVERVDIDHIIPISVAKTKEEVITLSHFSNLQLLKAEDNTEKGKSLYWV